MNKAFDFLKQHKDVSFATVEQNKPRIRVFQVMWQEDKALYFATAPHKEVYKQLLENPAVEILGLHQNISIRMVGTAHFDVADKLRHTIYNENPVLPRLYKSVDDLVYFRLKISQVDYFDLTPTPPLFESFVL